MVKQAQTIRRLTAFSCRNSVKWGYHRKAVIESPIINAQYLKSLERKQTALKLETMPLFC